MTTLNAQNATVFGLTAQQFYSILTNQTTSGVPTGNTPGVTSISNTYATVISFNGSNQTYQNAQAIEDLFPSLINTGSNTYFNLNPAQVSITVTNQGFNSGLYTYQYPANSSYFGVVTNTGSIQVNPTGSATANLSNSTSISNSQVAQGETQFTFDPGDGISQSLNLSYQTGTTITNSIANGIANSTTSGSTTTVTSGVNFTGTLPGASIAVNDSVSQAWTQQQTQQINYTDTQANAVDTNVTTSVTVDLNSATPSSKGQYTWVNPNGQTVILVPYQQYVAEVLIDQSQYSTPVPNTFQITGPGMTLPMQLVANLEVQTSQLDPIQRVKINQNVQLTYNAEQAINQANSLGYSQYSGVDTSLFTYEQTPLAVVTYSGLINSNTNTGTYSSVSILPVATSQDAQTTKSLSSNLLSAPTQNMDAISNSNSASDVTYLNLVLAAKKLSSSSGVFYDNTKTEDQLATQAIDIVGGFHDHVKLGNKSYMISNFSDSQVSLGSGYNTVTLSAADNHNFFAMGNGSSNVILNGNGNNIKFDGGYNNVQINGSTGSNYILGGAGPIALTFNNSSGFTQISNWDNTQDFMRFKGDINLKDVRVIFDVKNWSYDVYVADKLTANLITTGGLSHADAASAVSPSVYAAPLPYNIQSNAGFLNGLYVDAFNAAPDAAGFSYWIQQLNSGVSRTSVIQNFFLSDQFNAENSSNSQYVNALYEDLLGRPAESAGFNYWTGELNSGQSKVVVVGSFLNSAEFNNLVGHG